ncbi:hypothetical protein [Lacipirellula parvula]|uniref:Uncharacterized protein n=1 Tax=Lacipirellula parvula TaxID=2650471 RepID=A0A5K7XJ33_9BACT|nr:hypothetical protein [Lacipirellula parvula]BBO34223.1 hypothetical protein PLANPX_3835 [Lacipirellula parvula]
MNERKAQLVARIRELLEARRHELRAIARLEVIRPRVRILRTMACLLLMASTAQAAPRMFQQVPPPARPTYCGPKVIVVVSARRERPVIYYGGGFNPYAR